jgi:hypothetical protein
MFNNRKNQFIAIILVSLLCATACTNERAVETKKELIIDLNSPENLCLRWAELLDSNKIEEAKLIATDSAKSWLDAYSNMLSLTKNDTIFAKTNFDTIYCKPQRDSCTCYYLIKIIDGDLLKDSFLLVKINGTWKMGVPPRIEDDIFLDQSEEQASSSKQIK